MQRIRRSIYLRPIIPEQGFTRIDASSKSREETSTSTRESKKTHQSDACASIKPPRHTEVTHTLALDLQRRTKVAQLV